MRLTNSELHWIIHRLRRLGEARTPQETRMLRKCERAYSGPEISLSTKHATF